MSRILGTRVISGQTTESCMAAICNMLEEDLDASHLEVLDLSQLNLKSDAGTFMESVQLMPCLTTLILDDCRIRDQTVASLPFLPVLKALRYRKILTGFDFGLTPA